MYNYISFFVENVLLIREVYARSAVMYVRITMKEENVSVNIHNVYGHVFFNALCKYGRQYCIDHYHIKEACADRSFYYAVSTSPCSFYLFSYVYWTNRVNRNARQKHRMYTPNDWFFFQNYTLGKSNVNKIHRAISAWVSPRGTKPSIIFIYPPYILTGTNHKL